MNATEARLATDLAIDNHRAPLITRAIADIEASIAASVAARRYHTIVNDMAYAHHVREHVITEFKRRGYEVSYESVTSRRSCPSGIYAYTLDWSKG